jgi:hypothetical protein
MQLRELEERGLAGFGLAVGFLNSATGVAWTFMRPTRIR